MKGRGERNLSSPPTFITLTKENILMVVNDLVDPQIFDRMQNDEPVAMYIKTSVGKVGVFVWNHMTRKPDYVILAGNPKDPNVDIDNITVKLWDEVTQNYFENTNRRLLEAGKLAPYTRDIDRQRELVNMITDEEIDEILGQKFFSLANKLKELTSITSVKRIYERAIELNKQVKTINHIKARLEELQAKKGLDSKALDEYYQNLKID